MSDEPVRITLRMTERDFVGLIETGMKWADPGWAEQWGRFESVDGEPSEDYHPADRWAMIYWIGVGDYAALMLARAFLDARGIEYEVAFDTADDFASYVILTDYRTPSWRSREVTG